jgi:hypothetical protein
MKTLPTGAIDFCGSKLVRGLPKDGGTMRFMVEKNGMLGMLLAFCLMVAMLFLLPACAEEPEGQLPTLQPGDRWVWAYSMGETTSTLTEEVIGDELVEGRDCYVIDMSFDPPSTWTYDDVVCTATSTTHWADKAAGLLSVKTQSSYSCNGTASTYTTTYSYNPWTSLFPLEVGREVETQKTTIQYSDGSQQGEPVVSTERYTIVSRENVTVAAGTFGCWKLTMYDSATEVTQTMWLSDQVKSIVKIIDAEGNTVMELQSYSVS